MMTTDGVRGACAALFAACLLLCGCAGMAAGDAPALDGTAWVLASIGGAPVAGEGAATARFEGGRVQGSDGCNRYTAPYERDGASLKIGARGASTMMACPPERMKQAEAFMAALTGARRYRVEGGRLHLLGADGAVLASFDAQPRSLAGTSWKVTGFNNGRLAVVSTLPGTELTLAFSNDGRYSGSAGCNTFNGEFTAQGAKVGFGPAAATRRMCPQPAGVMEQEQQYLKALQSAATAGFEGERLELRTTDGALAATLARQAAR
jgi:heat shock protein HslJ